MPTEALWPCQPPWIPALGRYAQFSFEVMLSANLYLRLSSLSDIKKKDSYAVLSQCNKFRKCPDDPDERHHGSEHDGSQSGRLPVCVPS